MPDTHKKPLLLSWFEFKAYFTVVIFEDPEEDWKLFRMPDIFVR